MDQILSLSCVRLIRDGAQTDGVLHANEDLQ